MIKLRYTDEPNAEFNPLCYIHMFQGPFCLSELDCSGEDVLSAGINEVHPPVPVAILKLKVQVWLIAGFVSWPVEQGSYFLDCRLLFDRVSDLRYAQLFEIVRRYYRIFLGKQQMKVRMDDKTKDWRRFFQIYVFQLSVSGDQPAQETKTRSQRP